MPEVDHLATLNEAIERYQPSHVFALFSGGHDSLVNTHITARHPKFTAVVHLNTGIGIEETREFVRETCKRYGWPLIERHPPTSYEEIVLKHGLPGPAAHSLMYRRLKERSLRQICREYKSDSPLMFTSGVRSQESRRRMGYAKQVRRDGKTVWVTPILEFSQKDINQYIEDQEIIRNQVVANLHMSGECLCGAFGHPGELEEIAFWYPTVAARIRALEKQCFDRGLPWNWGSKPTAVPRKNQMHLPLCQSCETRWDALTEPKTS